MLSEDDLDDIAYIFTAAGDDEDWPDEAPGAATMPRH